MVEEDLYDEIILPTFKVDSEIEEQAKETEKKTYSIYIGNFTWWTTDQELQDLVTGAGVTDLVDIHIHDCPHNGLSKGYATVTVESTISIRLITTRLQDKTIHNRKIYVNEFVLANMEKYENAFNELIIKKNVHGEKQPLFTDNLASPITAFTTNLSFPPPSVPTKIVVPQTIGISPMYLPVHSSELQIHPVIQSSLSQLVYPPNTPGNLQFMAQVPDCIPEHLPSRKRSLSQEIVPALANKKMLTKEEFEEVFGLNRAVVERSIERASQDAEAGLYAEAIETLVTAISLIKESRLGSDPQGIALMKPLQELLQDIELESLQRKKLLEVTPVASSPCRLPLVDCHRRSEERSFSPYHRKRSKKGQKHERSVSPTGRCHSSDSSQRRSPYLERERKRSLSRERFHHDQHQGTLFKRR